MVNGMQMIGIPRVECIEGGMHAVEVNKFSMLCSCTFKRVYNVWNLAWTWSWGKLVSRQRKTIERHRRQRRWHSQSRKYRNWTVFCYAAVIYLYQNIIELGKVLFLKHLLENVLKTHTNRTVSFWCEMFLFYLYAYKRSKSMLDERT